jgi:membrane protein
MLLRQLKGLVATALDFLRSIGEHGLFTHAAASAFFLFLSLPPALLALVSLVGLIPIEEWTEATTYEVFDWFYGVLRLVLPADLVDVYGLGLELRFQPSLAELQGLSSVHVAARAKELVHQTLPADLAGSIAAILDNILGKPHRGLLTVSFLTILWSASGATRAAMRAMSAIYEVRARPWILRNLLSLLLTVGFLATWTLSLALLPLSNTLAGLVVGYFGLDQGVRIAWSGANWGLGGFVLFLSVVVLNRLAPDVPLRLRALIPGSLLTVSLWGLLSLALGEWMERSYSSYNTTYGTLAAVIVLLLWCYLMSIGLLLGAELNTAILRLRRRGLEAAGARDLTRATQEAVEEEIEPNPIERVALGVLPGPLRGAEDELAERKE